MKKLFLFTALGLGIVPTTSDAQLLQDASTSTAIIVRDPARQASTEIDAVISNPAGTAFMNDGWHFSFSGRMAKQTVDLRSHDLTSVQVMEDYIPSLQAAFKKKSLAVSLSYANEGGYGMIDNQEIDPLLTYYLNRSSTYNEAIVKGKLYNNTFRLGASVKLTPQLSAYLGLRANYVWEKSQVDVIKIAETTTYKHETMSGWGFTPVIGVDYKTGDFNFAAKYEFEQKVGTNDNYPSFHIPAVLSAGASWNCAENVTLSVGGSWSHVNARKTYGGGDNRANIGGYYFQNSLSGVHEEFTVDASISFVPVDRLTISAGYLYALQPALYKTVLPESLGLQSIRPTHGVSGGLNYELSKHLSLDFGVSYRTKSIGRYPDSEIDPTNLNGFIVSGGVNVNI